MSLWDDLPAQVRNGGALDGLQPLLDNVATPTDTERTEADGTWRIFTTALGGTAPLSLNPSTGAFTRGAQGTSSNSTPIEFPDPSLDIELGLRLTGPGGSPDGTVRLILRTPSAIVRLPFLRGAMLDPQGQLRADPANPSVKFILPELKIRFLRPVGQGITVDLLSASTGPTPVDEIYDFVRMEPPYALIGPGDVVGFAFRTAVLDLAGNAGPSGVPAEARVMPAEWQGFYLPEARLFVAPSGLEGLAVSAGVRNLWIGFGRHAGVTGVFEAEVVNRGAAPTVRLRFQSTTGAWIGVPDADSATPIDVPPDVRLFVDAGGGLAPYRYAIRVGSGSETTTDRANVAVPVTGTVSIVVRVTDASSRIVTRTIAVRRSGAPSVTLPSGASPVGVVSTGTSGSRVVLVSQTATEAVLRVEPEGGTVAWSWTGGSATGERATVPVAAGARFTVTATRTRAAGAVLPIDAYMLFDRPTAADDLLIASTALDRDGTWADNPVNVHAQPANSRTGWRASPELVDTAFTTRLAAVPAGTTWTVQGWASYEGDDSAGQQARNLALSERRRDVLVRILERNGFAGRVTRGTAHGHASAKNAVSPDGATAPAAGAADWWRARAVATLPAATSETITAIVSRPLSIPPAPSHDPEPARTPVPDCFRKIGVRVEMVRSTFIRAEVYGEFDVQTAAEQRIAATSPGATSPPRTNPSDGICTFLVRLRIAEDRSSWDVTAEFRALEGDLDGLAEAKRGAIGDPTGLNILGAVAALSPLLAAATPPNPTAGELVPMVILGGAAVGIGASGVMQTRSVILRGGELMVTDGLIDPASGDGPRRTTVSVLLDVETSFTFDLGFIRVDPQKPITTRYKAVGLRSTWESRPRPDGSIEYLPLPVFDPSRGYSLDVPTGSLVAAPPLGELLRILGVRMSRDNPTYLEVEVGLGVDLGIVTVDTVRVRLRLDAAEAPQITKLGASIDVPGALHGTGYV
ncbi:MAG TPA: hypothetical protein VE861_11515, partial [Gemmatimonadaceae bacterium]|nr:hypothetical protein [Gemmatimonadaceae bacterium]